MLFCGALERSNNSYIEPIVEPCASKNQKEIFRYVGLIGKEILKKVEAVKKSIHQQKAELLYLCARKTNSIEITVIILRYIRNVNFSNSKRILKMQNFYENIMFSLL